MISASPVLLRFRPMSYSASALVAARAGRAVDRHVDGRHQADRADVGDDGAVAQREHGVGKLRRHGRAARSISVRRAKMSIIASPAAHAAGWAE
jgi:hypothetical protein